MKKIILVSILLLITAKVVAGELTEKDLEKISNLLDRQEKRIKEYVNLKIETVNANMDMKIGTLKADVESLRTEIRAIKWFIAVLVVIIVALIGIPQTVQLWRERKESKEIDMLNREIERVDRNYERLEQGYKRLEQQLKELKERKFFVGS